MDRDETIKLTIKSLLEVVQTGAKNIEIAVMEADTGRPMKLEMLPVADIEKFVEEINAEKQQQDDESKKSGRRTAGVGGAGTSESIPTRVAGEGDGAAE